MKPLFALIILFLSSVLANSQNGKPRHTSGDMRRAYPGCDLKEVPVIDGLRIGMPEAEFVKLTDTATTDGRYSVRMPDESAEFEGIRWIDAETFDSKLRSFTLHYSGSFSTLDLFARHLTNNFNLPFSGWYSDGHNKGWMICDGFEVRIQHIPLQLEIKDTTPANSRFLPKHK